MKLLKKAYDIAKCIFSLKITPKREKYQRYRGSSIRVKRKKEKSEKAQKIYQTQSLSALTYIEPHIYIQIFPLIQS